VIGTTRRARLVTAATAVAIAMAIAAFIALDPADDTDVPRDAYTIEADRACLTAKQRIVAAGNRSLAGSEQGLQRYGSQLVRIVAEWRSMLDDLRPPPGRGERAEALDGALRDVEFEAGALARLAREDADTDALVSTAEGLDALTGQVETAISELGLDRCERATIGLRAAPQEP
jgi:hypothetical protein